MTGPQVVQEKPIHLILGVLFAALFVGSIYVIAVML